MSDRFFVEGREVVPFYRGDQWILEIGRTVFQGPTREELMAIVSSRHLVRVQHPPEPLPPPIPLVWQWRDILKNSTSSLIEKQAARRALMLSDDPEAKTVLRGLFKHPLPPPARELSKKLGKKFEDVTPAEVFEHIHEIPIRMALLHEISIRVSL